MKPCKHLDFSVERYGEAAELKELPGFSCPVRYWERKPRFAPDSSYPKNVQFCGQGRGRINGIFQCYNDGEMHCYEPETSSAQQGKV
jgi:hypothetical protein